MNSRMTDHHNDILHMHGMRRSVALVMLIALASCSDVGVNVDNPHNGLLLGSWESDQSCKPALCNFTDDSASGHYYCQFTDNSALFFFINYAGSGCGNTFNDWRFEKDTLRFVSDDTTTDGRIILLPATVTADKLTIMMDSKNVLFYKIHY